jgi:hypothetical protein
MRADVERYDQVTFDDHGVNRALEQRRQRLDLVRPQSWIERVLTEDADFSRAKSFCAAGNEWKFFQNCAVER